MVTSHHWLITKKIMLFIVFVCKADSDSYYYTSQGNSPTVDSIDDVQDFSNTCSAFTLMGNNILTFFIYISFSVDLFILVCCQMTYT